MKLTCGRYLIGVAPMKIAICDDEQVIRDEIAGMLNEYFLSNNMSCTIDKFATGESYVQVHSDYDLVFMDYQLTDGNGIDFARRVREENESIFIVFSTSFQEHVFESFSLDTFRYLVKPISKDAVFQAMDAFVKLYQTNRKIIIVSLDKSFYVNADEVMYIEADKKYTTVRTTSGAHRSYYGISKYEADINNSHFFRTHRSYIVNMKYISEIERKMITLTNGEKIVISPKSYDAFIRSYMSYLKYKS